MCPRSTFCFLPCPTAARARGFTLMELLIALVMLSLTTLLLFSGLRLGSRAWEGVETRSERDADLRLARNLIESSLRQARPVELDFDGQRRFLFSGTADQLEFVAPLSAHVGLPGLYVLRFALENDGGGHQRLVLTRWLLHPEVLSGEGDVPAWRPLGEDSFFAQASAELDRDMAIGAHGRTLLLADVGRFALSYHGQAQGVWEPEWNDDWLDQQHLPSHVRLDLATSDADWPVALVPLPGPGLIKDGQW